MALRKGNLEKIVAEADRTRDSKSWLLAASFYEKALKIAPKRVDLWVQQGNMLKEASDYPGAYNCYQSASALTQNDADLFLQMGHLFKIWGRPQDAANYYHRSAQIDVDGDASRELSRLRLKGFAPHNAEPLAQQDRHPRPEKLSHETPSSYGVPAFDVTVVGKFGTDNGIAVHSHAFSTALARTGLRVQGVDTRPTESDSIYKTHARHIDVRDHVQAADPSLVSVFCDVIANSPQDDNWTKTPPSTVKIAYAVFDSTRIPTFWVDRLNAFDAVAVPDPWLIDVLKNSGVISPIFNLPLALDFSKFDEPLASSDNDKADEESFVIGCIAGFGDRKNLYGVVDSFREAFGDSNAAILRIHSTLNFSNQYENLLQYIEKLGTKNIIISCEPLSEKKYVKLLRSFDAYVNASKGEGYSITPREALYLGKPTVLSDNSAQNTLVKSGLVISVPTERMEPAYYDSLGAIECGLQSVPNKKDLTNALRDVYFNHSRIRMKADKMKAFAESFSLDRLSWHYRALVQPKVVFRTDSNVIHESYLETSDASFWRQMRRVQKLAKERVPKGERQHISVLGNDGGFFSLFNTFISHVVWNAGRTEVECIIPDWRVESIRRRRGIQEFKSFCYGRPEDGNLWLKYYYPLPDQGRYNEYYYDDDSFLSQQCIVYDDYNEKNEPLLTYINAYNLYKSPGFPAWRRRYHRFYQHFARPRERISTAVDHFISENFEDADLVIGCNVRHPSHTIEQPGGRLAGIELYIRKILDRAAGSKSFKVFVATDQESVIEQFKQVFGDRVIYRSGITRLSQADDLVFHSLSEQEKHREGHQIQHLIASDPTRWSTRMGDEVIIDAMILARCHAFIHVTSNIATAVSYMNPDIEMIYCE